eukprot:g751.t1
MLPKIASPTKNQPPRSNSSSARVLLPSILPDNSSSSDSEDDAAAPPPSVRPTFASVLGNTAKKIASDDKRSITTLKSPMERMAERGIRRPGEQKGDKNIFEKSKKTSAAAELYRARLKYKEMRKFGQGSVKRLEEEVKNDPNNHELNWKLGRSLWKTKNAEKALPYLEKASSANEPIRDVEELNRVLGEVCVSLWRSSGHVNTKLLQRGIDAFESALESERYEHNPSLLMQIHEGYKNLGDTTKALQVLQRLLQSCPGCSETNAARVSAASLYKVEDRLPDAITTLSKVVEKPPPGFREWHILFVLARMIQLHFENSSESLDRTRKNSSLTAAQIQKLSKEIKEMKRSARTTLLQSYKLHRKHRIQMLKRETDELQGTYDILLKKLRTAGQSLTAPRKKSLVQSVRDTQNRFQEVQDELYVEGEGGDGKLIDHGFGKKSTDSENEGGTEEGWDALGRSIAAASEKKGTNLWSLLLSSGKDAQGLRAKMIAELDADGDGKVSRAEILSYIAKKTKEARAKAKEVKRKARADALRMKQEMKAKAKEKMKVAKEQAKAAKKKAKEKAKEAKRKAKEMKAKAIELKAKAKQKALKKMNKLYECENDCGFRGTYDECCAHEESCTGDPWKGSEEDEEEKEEEKEEEEKEEEKEEEEKEEEEKEEKEEESLGKDKENEKGKIELRPPIAKLTQKQLMEAAEKWIQEQSTWLQVAAVFDKQEEFLFACDLYMTGLAMDADNFREWKSLAVCFYRNANLPMALTALENAIGLDPDNYDYKYLQSVWKGLPAPKLPPKSALTIEDIEHLTIVQLQEELRARSMPFKGDTNNLRLRLRRRVEQEDVVERRRFLEHRQKRLKERKKQNEASIKIQTIARGRSKRLRLKVLKRQAAFEKRRNGIIRLQARYHGWKGREAYQTVNKAEQKRLEELVQKAIDEWDHYSLTILLRDAENQFGKKVKLSKEVFVAAKKTVLHMRQEIRDRGEDPADIENEFFRLEQEALFAHANHSTDGREYWGQEGEEGNYGSQEVYNEEVSSSWNQHKSNEWNEGETWTQDGTDIGTATEESWNQYQQQDSYQNEENWNSSWNDPQYGEWNQ